MNAIETKIPGLLVIDPKGFGDEHGFFMSRDELMRGAFGLVVTGTFGLRCVLIS